MKIQSNPNKPAQVRVEAMSSQSNSGDEVEVHAFLVEQ